MYMKIHFFPKNINQQRQKGIFVTFSSRRGENSVQTNRCSVSISYLDLMPLATSQSVNRIKKATFLNSRCQSIAQWEEYGQQSCGPAGFSCVHLVTPDKSLKWPGPLYSQQQSFTVTDHVGELKTGCWSGFPTWLLLSFISPISLGKELEILGSILYSENPFVSSVECLAHSKCQINLSYY